MKKKVKRKNKFRVIHKQRGRSVKKLDKKRKAKRSGYRKAKSGKVYYESRRNRSDILGGI